MLLLASSSSARREMLARAGVRFDVVAASVDEAGLRRLCHGLPATEVALRLAAAKAMEVGGRHPEALVLGCDSIVEVEGRLLEKPATIDGLRTQLGQLRGKTHLLVSAAVFVQRGRVLWRHAGMARLAVRPFGESFLSGYIGACGAEVLHSVGGYHVEGLGIQLFDQLEGSEFVIRGLPLLEVLAFLRRHGELPA